METQTTDRLQLRAKVYQQVYQGLIVVTSTEASLQLLNQVWALVLHKIASAEAIKAHMIQVSLVKVSLSCSINSSTIITLSSYS